MRQILALSSLLVALGGCFEESDPVDETGAMQSSGEECTPGTEGCPCIEGGCVNDLECLSNVCVDAGSTSTATDGPETTSATSTSGPATSTSVGTTPMTSDGPLDEGPMTTDVGGDLPAGSQCDPFFDMCAAGLDCNGVEMEIMVCTTPGFGEQDVPCDVMMGCSAEFLCTYGLATCMTEYCCAALCDLTLDGECSVGLDCTPFYPMGAPLGYEHVGVCVG
jgi:hypothetical protein